MKATQGNTQRPLTRVHCSKEPGGISAWADTEAGGRGCGVDRRVASRVLSAGCPHAETGSRLARSGVSQVLGVGSTLICLG